MSSASQRLFEALDAISSEPNGVAVTDLANKMGVSKATASRLLASLVETGLVAKTDSQRHVLHFQLWLWGLQASVRARRLSLLTRPAAIHVSGTTGALIATSILYGKLTIFLEVIAPSPGTTLVLQGPSVLPSHACAPGKVALAYLSPERRREHLQDPLESFTDATISTMAELEREFEDIRAKGFGVNRGEYLADTMGIAVPIFDASGEVVACVSSSGQASVWDTERLEGLVPLLRSISDSASAALGFQLTANIMG